MLRGLLLELLSVRVDVWQLLVARFAEVITLADVLDAIFARWIALHARLLTAVGQDVTVAVKIDVDDALRALELEGVDPALLQIGAIEAHRAAGAIEAG